MKDKNKSIEDVDDRKFWKIIRDAIKEIEKEAPELRDYFRREQVFEAFRKSLTSLVQQSKEEERERMKKQAEYIMKKASCLVSNDCGLCLRGLQRKCDTAHTVALEHIFSTLTLK